MDDIIDVNTLFGPLPAASNDLPVDALLSLMQKHGVNSACTLSTLGLLLDPKIGNAATGAACAEHTELLPVATFNPTMYFGDNAPMQRLREDGFRLLRFFPTDQGWSVEGEAFRSLIAFLDSANLPVMIDVKSADEISGLTRVLESYPAPVILASVNIDLLSEAVAALRRREHWHLETSRLLAPSAMKTVVDTIGASQLLFGTGAPSRPVASALNTLAHAGISDEARRQILAANAHRILAS